MNDTFDTTKHLDSSEYGLNEQTSSPASIRTISETLPEFITRIMLVGLFGTGCFVISVEILRAAENGDLTWDHAGFCIAALTCGYLALEGLLQVGTLSLALGCHIFAAQIAWYEARTSTSRPLFPWQQSRIGRGLMLMMSGLIVAVILTIFQMAKIRGESVAETLQVCLAAGISLLPVVGAVWSWNHGQPLRAFVIGSGVACTLLFWATVALGLAIDQLSFARTSPGELAIAGGGVLVGGAALAGLLLAVRIHYLFRAEQGDEPSLSGIVEE